MSIRIGIGLDVLSSAGIDADATTIYNRIIADGGVSDLTRLNFFVKGLKTIYGSLTNVPVCYDAHWIGYKLGSGTGATSGQAAAKLYSLTVAGDAIQSTAASQPLLLAHNGDNYAWFPGVSTNYINSTTTYNTNDIDIEISIDQRSGTTLNNQQVIGTNGTIPIAININRGIGTIAFEYYIGGFRSCSAPFTLASTNIIRVTRNSTTGAVTFINNGVTLTTSGTQVAGAFDSAITSLCVGGYTSGYPFEGKINYVKCYIGGVLTRYFNPQEYSASTSQTAWTSSTGEVWTINTGTATTGYKGVLVDRTIVMSDGVDDRLECAITTFSGNDAPLTMYSSGNIFSANYNTLIQLGKTGDNLPYITAGRFNATDKLLFVKRDDASVSNELIILGQTMNSLLLYTLAVSGDIISGYLNNVSKGSNTVNLGQTTLNRLTIASVSPFNNGQVVFSTAVITNLIDNSTTRLAMYNLIRSLNNNAF